MLGISERLYFWVFEGAPDVNGLMFNDCVFNQLGSSQFFWLEYWGILKLQLLLVPLSTHKNGLLPSSIYTLSIGSSSSPVYARTSSFLFHSTTICNSLANSGIESFLFLVSCFSCWITELIYSFLFWLYQWVANQLSLFSSWCQPYTHKTRQHIALKVGVTKATLP